MQFDQYLTIEAIALMFGADPLVFGGFVVAIFGLTEFVKKWMPWFNGGKTLILPPLIGVFVAFLIPSAFTFAQYIRFGLQGAVGSILLFMIGSLIANGFSTQRKATNGDA